MKAITLPKEIKHDELLFHITKRFNGIRIGNKVTHCNQWTTVDIFTCKELDISMIEVSEIIKGNSESVFNFITKYVDYKLSLESSQSKGETSVAS